MTDVRTMIETAHRNVELISEPAEGRRAAEEIAKIASIYQAHHVVAASPTAEKLHAALTEAMEATGKLSWSVTDPVVLFDVNFASGTEFARAALRVRNAGASAVYGVALYRLSECGPTATECGLDDLFVLRADLPSTDTTCMASDDILRSGLF